MSDCALIIGAGSKIATALISKLLQRHEFNRVVAVSRSGTGIESGRLLRFRCDYSETSIAEIVQIIADSKLTVRQVYICIGILHSDKLHPEKRLEDIEADNLHSVMHINAIIPLLWIKQLVTALKGTHECRVAVMSARVGSIEDNRRGGWYAYRASKAALNMLVKTAALEYQRCAPNVGFLLFHPGTTDTPLSKPFQKSVPKDKLFNTEFVAEQLLEAIRLPLNKLPRFVAWDGERIPW